MSRRRGRKHDDSWAIGEVGDSVVGNPIEHAFCHNCAVAFTIEDAETGRPIRFNPEEDYSCLNCGSNHITIHVRKA